jgi:iron complex transport system ATP-binding protein
MLRTDNVTLAVPGKTLCRDLSFAMQPGECWGILGQNGGGKTTLLHALSGLARPARGEVSLQGRPLRDFAPRELALKLGVLLQEEDNGYYGAVREYVLAGRFPHSAGATRWSPDDHAAADAALDRMNLQALAQRPVMSLSGGERQRVRIAMLLAQAPDVYLLDEPLLHLDLRHQIEVMQLFRELVTAQNKTVVMVLHDALWAGRYCDQVLLMHGDGTAVAGASAGLLTRPHLEKLYQCGLEGMLSDREEAHASE